MPRNNPARFVVPFRTKIALIIFGFFLFLVLLEAGLRLGGFILLSVQEYGNRQSLKQKGAYRIMCLGESTTQGQYPPYLEKILNQRHTGMRFSVIDKGVAGTNSARILARLESNLAQCHPDMVVAMIGINDEEPQIPYEVAPIPTPKIMLFFESFRTYKLTRLLWLRILAKAKEIKSYMPNQNKERPRKIPAHLGGAGLKGAHTKQPSPASTEDAFKKAIELNPQSDRAYVGLGRLYRDQGKLSQAEDVFKKAIELNPKNVDAHIELGWAYRDQRKLSQAEGAFKKAIELNPRSDRAYAGLGRLYRDQGKLSQAKDALEKAIELNPRGESDRVYIQLGRVYRDQGKFSQAEDAYRQAIALNPYNASACIELGWFYRDQGKFSQVEDLYKNATELISDNDRVHGALSVLYEETGRLGLAKEYAQKADNLRLLHYDPLTVTNYRTLKEILDKKGIRLVCVQYAMRNIGPLKNIFQSIEQGIIFVDNEKLFRDAVRKDGYDTYFKDMFGGDFGHCTDKGNCLLAESIADTILKEAF